MAEETNYSRREFLAAGALALGLSACPSPSPRSKTAVHYSDLYNAHRYESISEAKNALENPKDSLLDRLVGPSRAFQYHTISARLKDMTPRGQSLADQPIRLVLTDGNLDIDFCLSRDYLEVCTEGLSTIIDSYLRRTMIGDTVEVTTVPYLRPVGGEYKALHFRNKDWERRVENTVSERRG